jgi:tetratricopeptide (TPR) repeat protein
MRTTGRIKVPTEVRDKYRSLITNPETANNGRAAESQERPGPATTSTPPNPSNPSLPRAERASGATPIKPAVDASKRMGAPSLGAPPPIAAEGATNRASAQASARGWFQKGIVYYNSGQFGQACRAFQAAATAAPQEAEYHIYWARSLALMKGFYTEAEQEFYRAIELEPKNGDYYAELGLFYQKINLPKQADEMFDKALELVPDHPIARRARRVKNDAGT